jgi:hypothetical protein
MIYLRVLIVVIALLFVVYYISVISQVLGLGHITDKEIKFIKAIIPFYYWS